MLFRSPVQKQPDPVVTSVSLKMVPGKAVDKQPRCTMFSKGALTLLRPRQSPFFTLR